MVMPTPTEAPTKTALPVIDVSGLDGSARQRQAVGQALHAACSDSGFFYISQHGIPLSLIEAVLTETKRFFALPEEAKNAVAMVKSSCRRGYDPVRGQILELGTPPDLKESFFIGVEVPDGDPRVAGGHFGANQWPAGLPEFRSALETYHAVMQGLSA